MVEVMRRDLSEHHVLQVLITENQLETMQMMEDVYERVGMNYPQVPVSRYVSQPANDFFLPCEEEIGSAKNPKAIDKDEGFSETLPHNNHRRWNLVQLFIL